MKIILYIIKFSFLIAFFIGVSFIIRQVNADNVNENGSVINIEEVGNYASEQITEEITKVFQQENYLLFVGKTKSYLIVGDEIEIIDDKIISFHLLGNKLYFLTSNKIITKEQDKYSTHYLESGTEYLNFYPSSDAIYLCGKSNNDAYFAIYNNNYQKLAEIELGGEGREEFVEVYPHQDGFILIGEKDSTSHLSPFKNVGQANTRKVFMIYLEDDQIHNEVYFDGILDSETLSKVSYQEDTITILLSSHQIYQLDYQLQLIPIANYQIKPDTFVITSKGEMVFLAVKDNVLVVNDQPLVKGLLEDEVLYSWLENGNLKLITKKANELLQFKISEYHIISNQPLVYDRYNYDSENLDNFQIESYFEELTKTIIAYDPHYIRQIDGEYQIKYQVVKEDKTSFIIEGKMLIKSFVNIINNGVYAPNKELIFFGRGKLNGKEIFNGYKITEPGPYELILTNVNNQQTTYNFIVVEGYYKEDLVVTCESDYETLINEDAVIQLELNKAIDIRQIIINNQEYHDFQVEDKLLIINLPGKSFYSIDQYQINKIIYYDNNYHELVINKIFTVKNLKPAPTINLQQEVNQNRISLKYQIEDEAQSIFYVKTEIYEQNNLVGIYQYNFNQAKVTYRLATLPKNPIIKHYLVWHNGKNLESKLLCEYQSTAGNVNEFLTIEAKLDLTLTELVISIDANKTKLQKLTVENQNLLEKIEITASKIEPVKIILVCGILSILTFCYILVKIRKKMVKNTKSLK